MVNPHGLLATFGVAGVFCALFAETGLFVGFFLPGDSLLFTAGVVAATPATAVAHFSLPAVLVAAAAGSVAGAQTGYLIGRRFGPRLLDCSDRPRLEAAVARARAALHRYGIAKAIVLARFIPLMRTVCNPLAGALGVPARTFTLWQVGGGLVWTLGMTLAGYSLGAGISEIDAYLLPMTLVVGAVSVIPIGLSLLRTGGAHAAIFHPARKPRNCAPSLGELGGPRPAIAGPDWTGYRGPRRSP